MEKRLLWQNLSRKQMGSAGYVSYTRLLRSLVNIGSGVILICHDILDKFMVHWLPTFRGAVKYVCSIGQFPLHLLKDELARAHISFSFEKVFLEDETFWTSVRW